MAKRLLTYANPLTIDIPVVGGPTNDQISVTQPVLFVNNASTAFLIELWSHGNDQRVEMVLYLGPFATVTMVADPKNDNGKGNGKLYFAVIAADSFPRRRRKGKRQTAMRMSQGGPNVIVIGNGG